MIAEQDAATVPTSADSGALPAAPIGLRVGACLLDAAISLLSLGLAVGVLAGLLRGPESSIGTMINLTVFGTIWSFLYTIFWFRASRRGQSPGKAWVGLQVVRSDLPAAPPLGRGRLVLRSFVKGLALPFLVLDLFLVLGDEQRRRSTADRLVGSRVVVKVEVP